MVSIGLRALGWIGGLWAAGELVEKGGNAVEQSGEAAQNSASLVKWIVIGGVAYAVYRGAVK